MKTRSGIRALGKNSRGGFTLVELIVVLVILAILAAIIVPSLTGYIDSAREKRLIVQTRQAVMAAQVLFDEAYGAGVSQSIGRACENVLGLSIGASTIGEEIYKLAELDDEEGDIKSVSTDDTGKISALIWQLKPKQGKSKGAMCKYDAANKNEPYKVTPGS